MSAKTPARLPKALHRLLVAQAAADLADWLDFVALGALVAYAWAEGPWALAWLAWAIGLPYLLFGPIAGGFVDRLPLERVLVLSNLGRGLATAALFFVDDLPLLLLTVCLRSCVDAFFTPAKQAAIGALVPAPLLLRANGLSQAINQAAKIAGPAAGGLLLVFLAPRECFLANAAVSLLAALLCLGLALPARDGETAAAPGGPLRDLIEAFAALRERPRLSVVLLLMAGAYFALFLYDKQIPLLTRELGFAEAELGLTITAAGTGGVLGALLIARLPRAAQPLLLVAGGALLSGALAGLLGLTEMLGLGLGRAPVLAVFAGLGLSYAAVAVAGQSLVLEEAPPDKVARVVALGEAANMLAFILAPACGALVAEAASVGASFLAGGLLLAAVGLATLVARARLSS